MSGAARQRRHRQRERADLVVLPLETEHNRFAEATIASGLLTQDEAMSKSKLAQAAAAVIRAWIKNFT